MKIHDELGHGINLIGEDGIRRPSPFVGLMFYNKTVPLWGKFTKMDESRISIFYSNTKKTSSIFLTSIYRTFYYPNTNILFPGEKDCPNIPSDMRNSFSFGDIVCRKERNLWSVWEMLARGGSYDHGHVMLVGGTPQVNRVEPKNNDGLKNCFWCNGQTQSVSTGFSFYNICTVCKR